MILPDYSGRIILCGMKHCGKTTQGRFLAEKLNFRLVDSDDLIFAAGRKIAPAADSVRELFKTLGWELFRRLETEEITRHLLKYPDGGEILALGGGAAAQSSLHEILRNSGLVVYLQLPEEVLFQRVIAGGVPPFLNAASPREDFSRICAERAIHYRHLAHLIVELDGSESCAESGEKLISALNKYLATAN